VAAVHKFYDMNDVDLKWKRINSYQGEFYRVLEDRAYTHEEISKMVDNASLRNKAIILLMASTGLRVGAIGELRIKDLTPINEYGGLYKIEIYAKFLRDHYFSYCTPECRSAIDAYLDYRRRYGERLTPESPLFRKEYDKEDSEQVAHPLVINGMTVYYMIWELLQKTGIREIQKQTESDKAQGKPPRRTELQACHGFRKFCITNMIRAKLDYNIREKLTGHKVLGMDIHYERLEESEFLEEYMKAVDFLTISNEFRLRKKVEKLNIDRDALEQRLDALEAHFQNLMSVKK
jgi:integrase